MGILYIGARSYSTANDRLNQKGDPTGSPFIYTYLVRRRGVRDFCPLRGAAIALLVGKATVNKAGPGGNELADDHVLLQTKERVSCGTDRCTSQHLDRVLEGGGREERVGAERGFRHAQ